MFAPKALPFINNYLNAVSKTLQEMSTEYRLSSRQKYWFGFCIMSILLTNTVCWAKFARISIGFYQLPALSWMFRRSQIPWNVIFHAGVQAVIKYHGITEGEISIDDTDKQRSKNTTSIYWVHKMKDKATGGFMMGQKLVFTILVTPTITIPVGFMFYRPDPAVQKWDKENKKLKKDKVPKAERPKKPAKNAAYPTIPECALSLLKDFKQYHPQVKVKCVLADALYGTGSFLDKASKTFGGIQVVSQIRKNQNIRWKNKKYSASQWFSARKGIEKDLISRGAKEVSVIMNCGRLYLYAHRKKRFIIALKYEGEDEYRYLVATDLSWRAIDIISAYTLRWLVEVFFQDWKSYEGWNTLTKHPGKEGSCRSLILSVMADHCLFFHPDQSAHKENVNLPVYTVGSICQKVKIEAIVRVIQDIIESSEPMKAFDVFVKNVKENAIDLMPSGKHMVGRTLGRMEPTPSLQHHNTK